MVGYSLNVVGSSDGKGRKLAYKALQSKSRGLKGSGLVFIS